MKSEIPIGHLTVKFYAILIQKKTKEKTFMALMAQIRVVGQRWVLKSAMMRWIYRRWAKKKRRNKT
jgi:hypothetical protein